MHTGEEAGVTARLTHIRIFIQMYMHIHAYIYLNTGEEAGVTARLRHIRIFIQMYTHIRAHTCTQVKRLVSQLD